MGKTMENQEQKISKLEKAKLELEAQAKKMAQAKVKLRTLEMKERKVENAQKRKLENQQKILVGAMYLTHVKKEKPDTWEADLRRLMEKFLKRDADRAAFDLKPLPKQPTAPSLQTSPQPVKRA